MPGAEIVFGRPRLLLGAVGGFFAPKYSRKSISVFVIECLFRCPYGSDQGFPLDGTKFHPNGPGPSRALDPLFDAVWDARTYHVRPAVEGRSSDVCSRPMRLTEKDSRG